MGAGLLVAEAPSQWPDEYEVRVAHSQAEDTASGLFTYTDNPFEEGADQFPGEVREIQDTPAGVTTAGGSMAKDDEGNLTPLTWETPEGILVEAPVAALPENATGA